MPFSAIIFDLDGTLIDSLDDLADAMNSVLKRYGFPEHPVDAYRYFIGDGIERLVQRALPEDERLPDRLKAYVAAMKLEYPGGRAAKTKPYDGIFELLDACFAAGLKTAVLTNKPDESTQQVVAKLLPDVPFLQVWGARPDLPRKPDPTGARRLLDALGVAPDETLFLGDSAVDMETAKGAGIYPVGALWGFRTADELFSAGARIVVKRPMDLMRWLPGKWDRS